MKWRLNTYNIDISPSSPTQYRQYTTPNAHHYPVWNSKKEHRIFFQPASFRRGKQVRSTATCVAMFSRFFIVERFFS